MTTFASKWTTGFRMTVRVGADLDQIWQFEDLDSSTWGDVNWTGYTAFFGAFKTSIEDDTVRSTLVVQIATEEKDGTAIDPADGKLRIYAAASELEAWQDDAQTQDPARGVVDIFGTDEHGNIDHVARGRIKVLARVVESYT